jgi:hypothetical protein
MNRINRMGFADFRSAFLDLLAQCQAGTFFRGFLTAAPSMTLPTGGSEGDF